MRNGTQLVETFASSTPVLETAFSTLASFVPQFVEHVEKFSSVFTKLTYKSLKPFHNWGIESCRWNFTWKNVPLIGVSRRTVPITGIIKNFALNTVYSIIKQQFRVKNFFLL